MPFNPVTGQWESDVAQPPPPAPAPYNPDPQDAIERVRLAQDLDASGLGTRDINAVQSRVRPDKGINIGRRNLVKGSTMEAIRPYLAMLYKQVADTPLGDQPHQRALGIAARVGVGGYLDAQKAREASNAEAVKSAEELQKERRAYIGSRASELAKHRWELDKERRAADAKAAGGETTMVDVPGVGKVPATSGIALQYLTATGKVPKAKPEEISLSPEALAAWGQMTAQTGQLPPGLGMGGARLKGKLLEAGASYLKEGQDLATNRLTYRADAASFGKLQQLKDGASAFRRTAEGNAQVMLDAAQKLQDTGSPLLNRPIREWATNVKGDVDVAAYRAARLVIIPEFSRLLTSATMSGQLTDEARKELGAIVRGEYTLPQMVAVVNILKGDGERREVEYQRQLDEILSRSRGGAAPTPAVVPSPADTISTRIQSPKGFARGVLQSVQDKAKKARGR